MSKTVADVAGAASGAVSGDYDADVVILALDRARGDRGGDPFRAGSDRRYAARLRGGPGVAAGEPGACSPPRWRDAAMRHWSRWDATSAWRGGRNRGDRAGAWPGHRRAGQRRGIRRPRHAGARWSRRWTRSPTSARSAAASCAIASGDGRPVVLGLSAAACCRALVRASTPPPSSAPAMRSAARAWDDAGGYDEALFFCWEELDFCLTRHRLRLARALSRRHRHPPQGQFRATRRLVRQPMVLFRAQPALCRPQAWRELAGTAAALRGLPAARLARRRAAGGSAWGGRGRENARGHGCRHSNLRIMAGLAATIYPG